MKLLRKAGVTSEIWQVFVRDSSSTTGAGLAGLVFNSSSLTAYYHRDTDTTATAITLATMTVGTFTSSGFKEIDATNMPGWYQFCPPNAALASGAKSCAFHLKGATNMAPLPIEAQLVSMDVDDSVRAGLTALPNATAGANTGLPVVGTQVPNATAGASGGLLISGSNSGTTTLGALTVTGATTLAALSATTVTFSGAVAFQSTFVVTGAVTFSSTFATTGTTTFNAFTVTNATTLSGAVSLGSTLGVTGTVTFNAFTVTNALLVSGTTTLTGAVATGAVTFNSLTITNNVQVSGTWTTTGTTTWTGAATFTNGLTSNITGNLVGTVSTLTTYTGNTVQTGDTFALANGASGFAAIKTDTGNLVTRITATLFSGITSLAQWLGLVAGKQTGNTTARTEVRATGAGGGTFDETTDSLEAVRDRGDVAWITATGFVLAASAPSWYTAPVDVSANVAAIKAKTDNLPVAPAAVGSAMTLTAAYDVAKGTVAMTESYAANGAAPTLVQAIYAIHQYLMDFGISGTAYTVKKLDNATTAFVVTINDATTPTGAART